MSKFKAGDLALSIKGVFLGQSVELVRLVHPGEEVRSRDGSRYIYTPTESVQAGWLVRAGEMSAVKFESTLMPLRGDFQPEQELVRELTQ